MTEPYGTVKFYSERFGDILADVDPVTTPVSADNILVGFELALQEWIDYHSTQKKAFEEIVEKAIDD